MGVHVCSVFLGKECVCVCVGGWVGVFKKKGGIYMLLFISILLQNLAKRVMPHILSPCLPYSYLLASTPPESEIHTVGNEKGEIS